MAPITGIRDDSSFGVFFKHLQANGRLNYLKIMSMNIPRFGGRCRFNHVAGVTTTGPRRLRRIIVFGVRPDRSRRREPFIFSMAGETQIVVVLRF